MRKITKLLFLSVLLLALSLNSYGQYKIALSFDGNSYDPDDIIAAPMALLILEASNNNDKLVHCDYSNNLYRATESKNLFGDSALEDQATEMKASIEGAASKFGFDINLFYEVKESVAMENARTNFMNVAAGAFDAGETLYYIVGGPMQAPIKMIEKIDENVSWSQSRKDDIKANIIAISHSTWNERFGNNNTFDQDLPTWPELINMGIKGVQLADQNEYDGDNDMNTAISKWNWLNDIVPNNTTDKYNWVFDRNPFGNKFDPSDAGMVYWLINGGIGYTCCNSADLRTGASTTTSRVRYASPAKIYELITGETLEEENDAPSDITLQADVVDCNTVDLSWTDTTGETEYRIRRKISGEPTFTNLTDVAANVTSYRDPTATGNTNYIYMVRPLVDNVAVALSNQPSVTTPACEGGGNNNDESNCDGYKDENGIVIMETEFTKSNLGLWIKKTDVSGYTGSGHLEFTGNSQVSGPAISPISYNFSIEEGGVYRLIIKARKRLEGAESDKSNDCYVKLAGDFDQSPNANDVHNGNALEADLRRNLKFFGGNANGWGWAQQLDLGGHNNKRNAVYTLKGGEIYTLTLHGRSKNFNIDKIVFYKTDQYSLNEAKNISYNADETCQSSLSVNAINEHSKIKIYPNPVKDILHIKTNFSTERIQIIDVFGRKIIDIKSRESIDIAHLKSGVYFLKSGNLKPIKFLKE